MPFDPTDEQQTTALRRMYNGVKSEYLAFILQAAVAAGINDPKLAERIGSVGITNLKQLFEED